MTSASDAFPDWDWQDPGRCTDLDTAFRSDETIYIEAMP